MYVLVDVHYCYRFSVRVWSKPKMSDAKSFDKNSYKILNVLF